MKCYRCDTYGEAGCDCDGSDDFGVDPLDDIDSNAVVAIFLAAGAAVIVAWAIIGCAFRLAIKAGILEGGVL